jgi:hypothetical protein
MKNEMDTLTYYETVMYLNTSKNNALNNAKSYELQSQRPLDLQNSLVMPQNDGSIDFIARFKVTIPYAS